MDKHFFDLKSSKQHTIVTYWNEQDSMTGGFIIFQKIENCMHNRNKLSTKPVELARYNLIEQLLTWPYNPQHLH